MAVVLILGYFTVVVLFSNAHGVGLIGSLGGLGADLSIGLGSRQSSAGSNYGGYKPGYIGGGFEAGIDGSSSLRIASASSLSSSGGFANDGRAAGGVYAGGSTASSTFGHSNGRTKSSGLGLNLGLGIGSGAIGNGNTFGQHKGDLGLSSAASASSGAANNIYTESDHSAGGFLSTGASKSAGGSLDVDISAGVEDGYSKSSTADVAGSLALNIEGGHSASAGGVEGGAISSHISSTESASHKLVGDIHGQGFSSSSGSSGMTETGLLGMIPIDSDRKREHGFKHASRGSTSLEGRLNAGSGSAASTTKTLLSGEKESRGASGELLSGVRSTIRVAGQKHGHSGTPVRSYAGSSSWSKESSFSTSHSAAHSQHAASSGSIGSTLSDDTGSHDSGLAVGFESSLGGSSFSDRPTVLNRGYKNSHSHSTGIDGAVGIGAAEIASASSNSGLKVSKHDHNIDVGLSESSEVGASVESSKTVGASKVISGSYGSSSSSSGSLSSNSANIAENLSIKAGLGRSIGAGTSGHISVGSGTKHVIDSEGVFTSGLSAGSSSGVLKQNTNSLARTSFSNDVSSQASNLGGVANSKNAIGANVAVNTELKGVGSGGHSALSKESLGVAHSSDSAGEIGIDIGVGLLGSSGTAVVDSGISPTVLSSTSSVGSSGTLAAGSLNAEKIIGVGIGVGLSGLSTSLGSKSKILKPSIDSNDHHTRPSGSHFISSANAGASSIISDSKSVANTKGDVGTAVIHSKGVLSRSSSTADNTGHISGDEGISSSSQIGGHGTRLSTSFSATSGDGGGQSAGSSGILGHINGLIGGIHKSVHVSTGGYGGTSSINTSNDRNILSKNSEESTGILGGILGGHASVGSFSSSGARSQPLAGYGSSGTYGGSASSSLGGYSSGHRGSYRGNLNSGASTSASSGSSYGSISGGLGLSLGR